MNLSQLLDPESWTSSREQMVAQLGGGGPQTVDLTAIASDGSPVRLAVVRRLLFERGRPVAIQDSGHALGASRRPGWRTCAKTESLGIEEGRFAEQLKQLHRLSTTSYVTLEQALQDHLETGCQPFQPAGGYIASSGGQ